MFLTCVAIWGTTWLAITFQLGPVAPEVSVSHRFLLAALCVALWCRARGLSLAFPVRQHAALALLGVTMYGVSYIAVYHAERFLASGLVAIGYSASPLLSMLGARAFLGQPIAVRQAAGSAMGLAGITLIYWPEVGSLGAGDRIAAGIGFTVLAVVVSVSGGLLAQRNHQRGLHGWPTMAWSMAYGGFAALAVALALGRDWRLDASAPYLLSLLYLSVLGTVITFAGWLTLVGRIGVARASYVGVMAPIVALLISTVFEGLSWHGLTVAGVAVSIAGNVLVLGGRR